MVVKASGPISMIDVVNEFGGAAPHSLSEYYRGTGLVSDVTQNNAVPTVRNSRISMSNFYNTVRLFTFTIAEHVQQINLRNYLLARGWDGNTPVQLTLAAGWYLWSDDVNIPAVTTGIFPNGLTFTNNGFIMGKGGRGGNAVIDVAVPTLGPRNGQNGGTAFSLSSPTTIINNSFIGGGGGGGGCTNLRNDSGQFVGGGGGGGAGGGRGGDGYSLFSGGGIEAASAGGAGGGIGSAGANGTTGQAAVGGQGGGAGGAGSMLIQQDKETDDFGGGGGGGRIFPGVGGVSLQGGHGAGGSANAPGQTNMSGGGGGWGASGGNGNGGAGGAGGAAIARNGQGLSLAGNLTTIYGAVV